MSSASASWPAEAGAGIGNLEGEMMAKEEVLDYRAVKLSGRFAGRVAALFEKSAQRKALEEEEKELRREIGEELADKGERSVTCNGVRVTYVSGIHATISKQKLLEAGVPVAAIEKATVTTNYNTVKLTREGKDE